MAYDTPESEAASRARVASLASAYASAAATCGSARLTAAALAPGHRRPGGAFFDAAGARLAGWPGDDDEAAEPQGSSVAAAYSSTSSRGGKLLALPAGGGRGGAPRRGDSAAPGGWREASNTSDEASSSSNAARAASSSSAAAGGGAGIFSPRPSSTSSSAPAWSQSAVAMAFRFIDDDEEKELVRAGSIGAGTGGARREAEEEAGQQQQGETHHQQGLQLSSRSDVGPVRPVGAGGTTPRLRRGAAAAAGDTSAPEARRSRTLHFFPSAAAFRVSKIIPPLAVGAGGGDNSGGGGCGSDGEGALAWPPGGGAAADQQAGAGAGGKKDALAEDGERRDLAVCGARSSALQLAPPSDIEAAAFDNGQVSAATNSSPGGGGDGGGCLARPGRFWLELRALTWRALKLGKRDVPHHAHCLGSKLGLALILGVLWLGAGRRARDGSLGNVRDIGGFYVCLLLNHAYSVRLSVSGKGGGIMPQHTDSGCLRPSATACAQRSSPPPRLAFFPSSEQSLLAMVYAFSAERVPVARERVAGMYGDLPYLLAKLLVELPLTFLYNVPLVVMLNFMVGLASTPQQGALLFLLLVLLDLNAQAITLVVTAGITDVKLGTALACVPLMVREEAAEPERSSSSVGR